MYPNEIFLGMGMYEICIVLGFLSALIYLRIFADRARMEAKLQNLCILCALAALVGGYCFAVLTQAVYNALKSGHFQITQNTGATFYGGLIGGAALFIAVFFVVGHFRLGAGNAKKYFPAVTEIAAGSIALAHAFGRMGCLFAGCCHGKVTDAWYGVYNAWLGQRTVPIQLFEAVFLLALCAILTWRLLRGKTGNLAVYLSVYAIWRFVIEFFRDDDRGMTVVPFLTPSQFTAILLFLGGAVMWGLHCRTKGKEKQSHET